VARQLALFVLAIVVAACSPGLVVELEGVYDVAPDSPVPRFVARVRIENPTGAAIVLEGPPTLRVRSVRTGGDLPVPLETLVTSEALGTRLEPGTRFSGVYDLWRLGNLYEQDIFPELRRSPADMRFRVVVETGAGRAQSEEWHGVSPQRSPDALFPRAAETPP
jgi:hypothetical protein